MHAGFPPSSRGRGLINCGPFARAHGVTWALCELRASIVLSLKMTGCQGFNHSFLRASESKAASYLDMGKEPKVHACPHCPSTFGKKSNLTRHVRVVHEKRRDHACPHCAAAFGRASDLMTHVRTVHEKRRDHACPDSEGAEQPGGSAAEAEALV